MIGVQDAVIAGLPCTLTRERVAFTAACIAADLTIHDSDDDHILDPDKANAAEPMLVPPQ